MQTPSLCKLFCITQCNNNDTTNSLKDVWGIVKIASIRHPITNTAYFWLGAVNKWRYIMAKDFPTESNRPKTD